MRLKAHKIYLFPLRNGKKRLGYGESVEHALDIMSRFRTAEEMAEIVGEPKVIRQQDMQQYVKELG